MPKKDNNFKEHIIKWFRDRQDEYFYYGDASPEIVESFAKETGDFRRDPDRAIRSLHKKGILERHPSKKGYYRWANTDNIPTTRKAFSLYLQEDVIAKRGLVCQLCKLELQPYEAQVAPILDFSNGGKVEVSNGQVLCERDYLLLALARDPNGAKKMFEQVLKTLYDENSGVEQIRYSFFSHISKFIESEAGTTLADVMKKKS